MFDLENYIKQCDQSQAAIFGYLREMILSCSTEIHEEVTDNKPTYKLGTKVFSVSNKSIGTTLSFSDINNEAFPKPLHFNSIKEIDMVSVYSSIQKALYN